MSLSRRSLLRGFAAAAILAVAPSLPKFGTENPLLSGSFGYYSDTLWVPSHRAMTKFMEIAETLWGEPRGLIE